MLWHIGGHVTADYGNFVSESRSWQRPASGTLLPPFPRGLLMGLHTWEDRLRCLGDVIIRDTSLIISRAPAPRAGSSFPCMRQAPCSRDKRKVELAVVTLCERSHFKLSPWALIDHWYWKERESSLNKSVQFRSRVVLAYLLVPGLNYIVYRCVHTFLSEACLQLFMPCVSLHTFPPAHSLTL